MRKLIITAAATALVCLAVPAVAMPAKATTATVEAIIMDGIAGITAVITNAQKGENR